MPEHRSGSIKVQMFGYTHINSKHYYKSKLPAH